MTKFDTLKEELTVSVQALRLDCNDIQAAHKAACALIADHETDQAFTMLGQITRTNLLGVLQKARDAKAQLEAICSNLNVPL